MTIKDIREGLIKKEFSALELAERFLNTIEQKDKELHAFINTTPELAKEQAKEIDKKLAKGENLAALAGVPCSIKDSILVDEIKCTAGSKMLENYTASYDATVVTRMKKAGAVILGKTNLDEFSMGTSTENSAFGVTKNPHDLTRVAGGSSGGSAAAVASGESVTALGGDTGGSIRLPASFCGVVGLKPTYGAVSRYGIIAMASSLDQIGPMANTVEDCETVFNTIRGKDPLDSTSVDINPKSKIQNPKIGIPKEFFDKGLDLKVKKIIEKAIQKFKENGSEIVEISLPRIEQGLAIYYIINTSEVSSNLARFDGMRYGLSEQRDNLLKTYLATKGKGFGAEVKRRIMLGTYALSSGYYDAYYIKAQKIRALLKQDFDKAFEKVDVIMGPVAPYPAFKIGEKTDPLSMYLADIYTVSPNLAGLPGISIPAGETENLPVGLQIIGKPYEEQTLFEMGKTFESL